MAPGVIAGQVVDEDLAALEVDIADLDMDELAHTHGGIEEELQQDLVLHIPAAAVCAMYRLCIDLTTKSLLPPKDEANGPNAHQRGNLNARLNWLFDKARLPVSLKELSHCIREDGNDAAHDGSVDEDEAADLQDFTIQLLENVYTVPKRIELAKDRRNIRRSQS